MFLLIDATSRGSWLTKMVVRPGVMARSRVRHRWAAALSTAASGSSNSRTAGLAANPRTNATWAACPPESLSQRTPANSCRPDAARSRRLRSESLVTMVSAWTTVANGGSPGCWVTTTTPRRWGGSALTSASPKTTCPPVRRPPIRPRSVVLPDPFGPTRAVTWPERKVTPLMVMSGAGWVGAQRSRSASVSRSVMVRATGLGMRRIAKIPVDSSTRSAKRIRIAARL